ncbi:stage II sporulation protein AB (anti-sigma F factor) [Alicyclobacillus tengchongensis]|uniref:Anti-sigma F factor n=2 Tax=Alicyclobacillus tolerans TaxID=90970 RepID=A0ABT9LWN2_9BACL|nr:anti-sigma F factor [Alicyclobacillus tengchongensis]MDP9728688.1 stage II sporulation protein AB (anti-sigma F factor) [Alicyclobacillus tengchongensis]
MTEYLQEKVHVQNYIRMQFPSCSANESFARVAVASFVAQLDPTLEELTELKTAVSEAVTNAIIHGYENSFGEIRIECSLYDQTVKITIEDDGIGIEDVDMARQPLYTSRPELERSGMGLTIMESFVDRMEIQSEPGQGTRVTLVKSMGGQKTSQRPS